VRNASDEPIVGQAIPSYGPQVAGQYFRKLDCFCFSKQTFAPGEVRRMPVTFVIESGLPKDVNTVTLAYTFFKVEGAAPRAALPQNGGRAGGTTADARRKQSRINLGRIMYVEPIYPLLPARAFRLARRRFYRPVPDGAGGRAVDERNVRRPLGPLRRPGHHGLHDVRLVRHGHP